MASAYPAGGIDMIPSTEAALSPTVWLPSRQDWALARAGESSRAYLVYRRYIVQKAPRGHNATLVDIADNKRGHVLFAPDWL